MNETYIAHHGILGQKWGIRRYQNPDGSLTNAGKKHYSQKNSASTSIEKNVSKAAVATIAAKTVAELGEYGYKTIVGLNFWNTPLEGILGTGNLITIGKGAIAASNIIGGGLQMVALTSAAIGAGKLAYNAYSHYKRNKMQKQNSENS